MFMMKSIYKGAKTSIAQTHKTRKEGIKTFSLSLPSPPSENIGFCVFKWSLGIIKLCTIDTSVLEEISLITCHCYSKTNLRIILLLKRGKYNIFYWIIYKYILGNFSVRKAWKSLLDYD